MTSSEARPSAPVIVGAPTNSAAAAVRLDKRWDFATRLLAVAGWLLLVVAWTHLLLIWVPWQMGSVPWEYAASTQTTDVFPLALMGGTLAAAAAVLRGAYRTHIALAVLAILAALLLLLVAGLLVLDLPVAWKSVAAPVRSGVIKTACKSLIFAVLFGAYHIWLAVRLLKYRADALRGS